MTARTACLSRIVTAAAGAFLALWVVARPANSAPLEVYGQLPSLEEVALSPDGTRLAFVHTAKNARTVAMVSLADNKLLGGLNVGEVKLRGIRWADNDNLLIETSTTTAPASLGLRGFRQELFGVQVYNLSTRVLTTLPRPVAVRGMDLLNVISGRVMVARIDGHTVLYVPAYYVAEGLRNGLFRVDLSNLSQRLAKGGSHETSDWLVNAAGEVVAEEKYSEHERRWSIDWLRENRVTEVASGAAAIEIPQILGFAPDGESLLTSSPEGDESVWRFLNLKEGKFSDPLAEGQSLADALEDPVTHRMVGGVHETAESLQYVFLDPARQAQWESVAKGFPGEQLRIASVSDDFGKFVIRVYGHTHGYVYVLVDMATRRTGKIGEVYEGLGTPLEVRHISYAAADGLNISAYLTLPQGKAPTKLPLIVLPHGGPAGLHDSPDFDWWSQALAAQGYAVLQPNFRGTNTTRAFMNAGFGQWGRKMQTDLSDGVRYLAKEGIINPARVCIEGAAYGGYAALGGVALDPGVYRCAVSVAGYSDLSLFLKWQNTKHFGAQSQTERYFDRFMGASSPDDPVLATISPASAVAAIKVPVLLIHGRDDTVVPFEQSQVMYDALKAANKPVELVTLKQEDHWLSRGETRLQMLQASVAFLKANNPPD